MRWLFVLALAACAGNLKVDPYAPAAGGTIAAGPAGIPDVRCAGSPETADARGFLKARHRITARLSRPDHRGYDLVTSSTGDQVLRGKLAYGIVDKSLDHEAVDLYACITGAWQRLGTAHTNADGRFAFALQGADRLPVGLRDLYASVVADRSGFRFLAYVAPQDAKLIVSDVDGTLTSSESSFIKAVVLGSHVRPQPGAPESLRAAAAAGYQIVYVTARGERFTDATRAWLGENGFPRGPVRLASGLFVTPGAATVAYKQRTMKDLGLAVTAGVGNRKSDVLAYTASGVPAERIFVKLPEYGGELGASLRAGAAVGFGSYGQLALP